MSDALAHEIMDTVFRFLDKAGTLAQEKRLSAEHHTKPDGSVVTDSDLAISEMARHELAEFIGRDEHLLLDEETISHLGTPEEILNRPGYDYTWILDPIDGTLPYSAGRHTWGVSLGVLKNFKPWLGAVYLPDLKELFLADGAKAWHIRAPFTSAETGVEIQPYQMEIPPHTVCDVDAKLLEKYSWPQEKCRMDSNNSAVVGYGYSVSGRSAGTVFGTISPWDMAGFWPVLKSAGHELRLLDGRKIERLSPDLLRPDWHFPGPVVSAHGGNIEKILSFIQERKVA